ncbi:hypothetical protein Pst134EA_022523 [Puccinia striiformis f. sp. tritici]|uniref:hypothetical protein n=1 Tax=Puccinia striiformis f. sp. tritici TaxID=168172 RepID=UPI0020073E83|nr:hypothetical protein Pst134EA_022523 [Puccinia striiformis f. sp. tritici]KAH9455046.1 hypothetical protein Pst134EA_022523 [Puccinia striiformis f. sp. tritici]
MASTLVPLFLLIRLPQCHQRSRNLKKNLRWRLMKALRRLLSFCLTPQAYVSYVSPQLLSDGSNISQWPDSLEDLALLVFGICKFCLEESNFMLLSATMDRSLTHVIKNSISVDLRPILRDSESSWDSLETLKKNFHKSVRSRQFDLLSSLVKLDSAPTPAHFNKFFLIVSELGGLGLHIPLELQGLFLQVLTQPPTGTTCTTLNNLILAASEKTDQLGPRDVQVMCQQRTSYFHTYRLTDPKGLSFTNLLISHRKRFMRDYLLDKIYPFYRTTQTISNNVETR